MSLILGRLIRFVSRLSLVVLAVLALLASAFLQSSTPAAAETPAEVAAETLTDGVYIGVGRPRDDEQALETAVERASFERVNLVVVKPTNPQPSAPAFARRVQEQTDADAALVFPAEGGVEAYVADDYSESAMRALSAAREASDPVSAVEAFTEALTVESEVETPSIIGQVALALVAATLVIAGITAVESSISRRRQLR